MSNDDDEAIAAEFAASWQRTEAYFLSMPDRWNLPLILPFIKQMQQKGYDRVFRAGAAMGTFILSRSHQHGLRHNQPRITIWEEREGVLKIGFSSQYQYDGEVIFNEKITLKDATLTPEIEALLQRLANYPID